MIDAGRADGNLLAAEPGARGQEQHQVLRTGAHARIERIVSPPGYADAPDRWYDQDWDEWVLVVSGSAGLRLAHETAVRVLEPGDYISIAAHIRHRVEWTDPEQPTIWLAVHHL
jgi:cupin 2 domain-containing protein